VSRRRHSPDVVLRTVGWALEHLLKKSVNCPNCLAWGEGVHRPTCEVARALKLYREWRDLEERRPPLVSA